MDDDRQLLRQFTQHNSQEAFATLTARYLSLVYSTCRRELGDADLAEDVTQAVFLILARKAPSLRREVVLSGWLFQTARFAARNARTSEGRRKAYEQKAADTLREQQMERQDAAWTEIEPLLNQSLAVLREGERECVLLRFFQGMSFAEAGAALGLSEDAARKRVNRALDKMRQVFIKNGVIVPSAALAVLLTAHAAKAAPLGLAPAIAQSTASVLAGHTTVAALTGSHAYQLSEGVMKAMKIIQIKTALGLTTAVVIGLSAYAVAHAMTLTRTKTPQVAISTTLLLPGHTLRPAAALTSTQVSERCRAAYAVLTSYQGTTTVEVHSLIAGAKDDYETCSASIQFARPGKIHAEATIPVGQTIAYISDGAGTEESSPALLGESRDWKKFSSTEMAISGATGVAQNAATTIPALLLSETRSGMIPLPLDVGRNADAEVREDTVDGQDCYVLTAHLKTSEIAETISVWINEKTYLLRRLVEDTDSVAQTVPVNGKPLPLPAIKMHNEEYFSNERLDEAIPDSTFALPPVQ